MHYFNYNDLIDKHKHITIKEISLLINTPYKKIQNSLQKLNPPFQYINDHILMSRITLRLIEQFIKQNS